jgi:hypothetical protein
VIISTVRAVDHASELPTQQFRNQFVEFPAKIGFTTCSGTVDMFL